MVNVAMKLMRMRTMCGVSTVWLCLGCMDSVLFIQCTGSRGPITSPLTSLHNSMHPSPNSPSDGLNLIGLQAVGLSYCNVVCLDLAAELDADAGHLVEGQALAKPDSVCMAVDAYIISSHDAVKELCELRTAEDGTD